MAGSLEWSCQIHGSYYNFFIKLKSQKCGYEKFMRVVMRHWCEIHDSGHAKFIIVVMSDSRE